MPSICIGYANIFFEFGSPLENILAEKPNLKLTISSFMVHFPYNFDLSLQAVKWNKGQPKMEHSKILGQEYLKGWPIKKKEVPAEWNRLMGPNTWNIMIESSAQEK